MKKAMSLLTATAMAATLLAGCGGGTASSSAAPAADSTSTEASSTAAEPAADAAAEEGKVLNIWCWNDEFQSRFNDYYPGVKEIAADKSTTTLDNGVTVKWTINPNDNNNYQNKLDEALLKQDSAAADDKIDIFLIEADYALKYVDSEYTLDVKKDVGLDLCRIISAQHILGDGTAVGKQARGRLPCGALLDAIHGNDVLGVLVLILRSSSVWPTSFLTSSVYSESTYFSA